MNLMTVRGLAKSHGLKPIFSDLSFGIERGDRIGLIGINGSGKSTLLRLLAGADPPDAGTIEMRQDLRIRFLPQHPDYNPDHTVIEHIFFSAGEIAEVVGEYERVSHRLGEHPGDENMLRRLDELSRRMDAISGWDYETRAKTILTKLGVADYEARMGDLSGGYRKRAALARTLMEDSDLLMLDEPTNQLDADTIGWIEEYLERFSGALVLVTHDRYFLDRVTDRILELDRGQLREYAGNFTYYVERKAQWIEAEASREARRRNILRKELEWLKRGPKARRTKSKARIGRIEELSAIRYARPKETLRFGTGARRLGTKVVELRNVAKAFDGRTVIGDFSYTIERGQRLGIIGPNGSGKTTLANLITGRTAPDAGAVIVGETVEFGYYDQENTGLRIHERAIEYVKREGGEFIRCPDGAVISASAAMEQFLFTPEMMYSPIEKLSGGERRRLYLVRTLMRDPNFLILDEPTNDLDIATLEALEDFLDGFAGCLVVISHDRYFLDRTVDQLISMEGGGRVRTYPGNYSTYEQIREIESAQTAVKTPERKSKDDRKPKETAGPKKLTFMEQRELAELEDRIARQEVQLKNLEQRMIGAATDYVQLGTLTQEHNQIKSDLDRDLTRWEDLAQRA